MAFRVPLATYRIQFNSAFTFADAKRIAPYLKELGVTDIYASPILKARKGSSHGYDVVDATALNPELGSDEDFNTLHEELRDLGLGFLLDIVPNHMAASAENAWWMSVLENGQHSRFLHYFDIDFSPVAAQGRTVTKVLLPILGRPYGESVEAQEILLGFGADGFHFRYFEHLLPLAPESYRLVLRECLDSLPTEGVGMELRELAEGDDSVPNSRFLKDTLWRIYEHDAAFRDALDRVVQRINGEAGKTESFNKLDALLDAQWYRLAYWRIASEKINYRRFFDVTDLVGVRVENPEVFEARNRRTLELIAEGKVTGLRVDHIDGLFDPIGHMRKLQLRLAENSSQFPVASSQSGSRLLVPGSQGPASDSREPALCDLEPATSDHDPSAATENREPGTENFYIVVEKILAAGEELPTDFPVSGTTGYDFLDSLNALFVDPSGLVRLGDFYRRFTGVTQSFADVCYERKKQVISELFSGEMRALGKRLSALAMLDRNARDFSPSELLAALTEITACMRVYRTYVRDGTPSDADRRSIHDAVAEARQRAAASVDRRLLTFLERMLLLELPSYMESEHEHWLAFVMRWQQFTGRVMAKGVEDTSFYNYNRLISLNEVGGWPGRGGELDPVAELHARNERTQRHWPDTLNATSTHDTKRGQDARARINVLSEMAVAWERHVRTWARLNERLKENGVPEANEELLVYQTLIGMWPPGAEEMATLPERLRHYLEKAAREAKTHTSWIAPNADFERRFLAFGDAILRSEPFRASLLRFQKRVSFHGFLNGLAQVVLKIASPGVPDFYQGTELWDFSLVDPDNRRPVDYEKRSSMLGKMKATDGRGGPDVAALLRRWQDGGVKLFVTWRALDARARHAEAFRRGAYRALDAGPNVFAFARGDDVVVAVPRLTTRLTTPARLPLGAVWGDATLHVSGSFRNVFTAERVEGERLALSEIFATFPVAILERG